MSALAEFPRFAPAPLLTAPAPRPPGSVPPRPPARDRSPKRAPLDPAFAPSTGPSAETFDVGPIVEPHLALLRRVALRILGCPEQAQDAVQDAICALWQLHGRPVEIRGWLVRTVVHRSLHRRRSEGRRRRWEERAALDQDADCPICHPEDEIARRETLRALENALENLSSEHRVVLALRAAGLEYEEIAAELALPVGTIRSRLNRARRALRDQMSEDETRWS